MTKIFLNALAIVVLTVLTQLGGIAWLISLLFKHSRIAFITIYLMLALSASWIAPIFGRVPLGCFSNGPLQVHGWFYCLANRNYVTPELAEVLYRTAESVDQKFPGTKTQVLDASFPFFDGFPLFPHLSHDDGRKADLAFYYADDGVYAPGKTRSPLGYFAFEEGATECRQQWPTLRWDLNFLQGLWRELELDAERTRYLITVLTADPQIGKLFVEPHLKAALGVGHPKVRFQGCSAARHDDHIHLQLRD